MEESFENGHIFKPVFTRELWPVKASVKIFANTCEESMIRKVAHFVLRSQIV